MHAACCMLHVARCTPCSFSPQDRSLPSSPSRMLRSHTCAADEMTGGNALTATCLLCSTMLVLTPAATPPGSMASSLEVPPQRWALQHTTWAAVSTARCPSSCSTPRAGPAGPAGSGSALQKVCNTPRAGCLRDPPPCRRIISHACIAPTLCPPVQPACTAGDPTLLLLPPSYAHSAPPSYAHSAPPSYAHSHTMLHPAHALPPLLCSS